MTSPSGDLLLAGRPKGSNKRSVAELERPASAQAAPFQQQMQPEPIPLKYVVQEAVKRWFEDTLLEAQRGDVKQQALLGEMYKVRTWLAAAASVGSSGAL